MARTDKIPSELGLPRPQEDPLSWLGQLTSRLYVILKQTVDLVNLLLNGYVLALSSLPTANAQNRGRLVIINGAGATPDKMYLCRYDGVGFSWIQVV